MEVIAPPALYLAALDLEARETNAIERARLRRMTTDPRLRSVYQHLQEHMVEGQAWRAYLDTCSAAAWAVDRVPRARAARARARHALDKLARTAAALERQLHAVSVHCIEAGLQGPLELALLPELIERAALKTQRYDALAREHVRALGRLNESTLPSPGQLVGTIAAIAAMGPDTLEPVNGMLEAAVESQKFVPLRSFVRAFDYRWQEIGILRAVRVSHAEVAAIGAATLNLPESFGRFSVEEVAEMWRECARGARRTLRPTDAGVDDFGRSNRRKPPLAASALQPYSKDASKQGCS